MNGIDRCPICNYHEATDHLYSLLGTAGICIYCYEEHAERPVDVHRAVLEVQKNETPPILKRSIYGQLKLVKCWVSWEEGYLPMKEYYQRMRHQQLIRVRPMAQDIEDDEMARRMASKIIKTAAEPFERRLTVLARIKRWFGSLSDAWRQAVDAGL